MKIEFRFFIVDQCEEAVWFTEKYTKYDFF